MPKILEGVDIRPQGDVRVHLALDYDGGLFEPVSKFSASSVIYRWNWIVDTGGC